MTEPLTGDPSEYLRLTFHADYTSRITRDEFLEHRLSAFMHSIYGDVVDPGIMMERQVEGGSELPESGIMRIYVLVAAREAALGAATGTRALQQAVEAGGGVLQTGSDVPDADWSISVKEVQGDRLFPTPERVQLT